MTSTITTSIKRKVKMRTIIILAHVLIIVGILYLNNWDIKEGTLSMFALCVLGCALVIYICLNIRLLFTTTRYDKRVIKHRKYLTLSSKELDQVYKVYRGTKGKPTSKTTTNKDVINAARDILKQLEYTKSEIKQMVVNATNVKTFKSAEELVTFILKEHKQ